MYFSRPTVTDLLTVTITACDSLLSSESSSLVIYIVLLEYMKYAFVIKNYDYTEHKFPQTVTVIKVVQANSFDGSVEFNQLQIKKHNPSKNHCASHFIL